MVRYEHSYSEVWYPLIQPHFICSLTFVEYTCIYIFHLMLYLLNAVFTRSVHILCHYKLKDSGKSPLFSLFTTVCNCSTLLNWKQQIINKMNI